MFGLSSVISGFIFTIGYFLFTIIFVSAYFGEADKEFAFHFALLSTVITTVIYLDSVRTIIKDQNDVLKEIRDLLKNKNSE